ncbi:MAG: excinuclease ABC subunit UvrB [Patescibacteria group bacterium]
MREKGLFDIKSEYNPAGDQPKAISLLSKGLDKGYQQQTLLGITGSGKTFSMANVIEKYQKPTLVIAHNKTLAAQLSQEYKAFFPDNAVTYFVSYYDYYQPEAYIPVTDTYIEKEAQINEEISRLRHETTQALLTRNDVIVVASVSCIYGLGSPVEYEKVNFKMERGSEISRRSMLSRLVDIHFQRTNADLSPGYFRAIGNTVEVMPVNERVIYRVSFRGGKIDSIVALDEVSRAVVDEPRVVFMFPAHHFVTPKEELERAVGDIEQELEERVDVLKRTGKNLEAERLSRRTRYDLAMIKEVGYCNGIENYSRHFTGRSPGDAPDTLLSYFPHKENGDPDFLTIIDESHVTIPQIRGMYAGDRSRKESLIEHGFRLPSALDNRPLKFDEFEERIGERMYTSATPGDHERNNSEQVVEQIIRPTGLLDPELIVRPVIGEKEGFSSGDQEVYKGQVDDFLKEAVSEIEKGGRVLATTLTKRMAEDLSDYLKERGVKAEYLHSDIKTIERVEILSSLRRGDFNCLVGVNLLREGLDLPEVSLIGILDADKEGFLRSETALIQIIGRAARNLFGRVILYADVATGAVKRAVEETERRRALQMEYNEKHGITPKGIEKKIYDTTTSLEKERKETAERLAQIDVAESGMDIEKRLKSKEKEMEEAVKNLDFETAAILRDEIYIIKDKLKSGG